MASQSDKLVRALTAVHLVQRDGIVRSSELGQTYRERLVQAGFLYEIISGWLLVTRPDAGPGASVSWYGSFWTFLAQYLESRFHDGYCLSAEVSLKRQTQSTLIPQQVTVMTSEDVRQILKLPFDTSLCVHSTTEALPPNRVKIDGIWTMDLPTALCRVAEPFYRNSPEDAEIALRMVRDPGNLLRNLLDGSNVVVAGRLVGAYRFLGDERTAKRIKETMEAAGNVVRVSNPFTRTEPMLSGLSRITSPYAARIRALWKTMRQDVIQAFADRSLQRATPADYLAEVEDKYAADAYNSLSIEGYRVTPELIERVRIGGWNPDMEVADSKENDALTARGYFQAFQAVKNSIAAILSGDSSVEVIEQDFQVWYREMFSPNVTLGVLEASQLAGYRNHPIFLRGSRYVPPAFEALTDCMEAFFDLMRAEQEPIVRGVLGHYIFVYIHPYSDGNGRIGRFLMNAALASGGYPWTVIRQTRRDQYLAALETASTEHDIKPFAMFVREEMDQKN